MENVPCRHCGGPTTFATEIYESGAIAVEGTNRLWTTYASVDDYNRRRAPQTTG